MTRAMITTWRSDLIINISIASIVKYLTKKLPAVNKIPLRIAKNPPSIQSLLAAIVKLTAGKVYINFITISNWFQDDWAIASEHNIFLIIIVDGNGVTSDSWVGYC